MGIGTRKKGTVVRCPKCSGQVVVPEASETGPPSSAAAGAPTASDSAPSPFDLSDVELLPPAGSSAENPFEFGPDRDNTAQPLSGVFLSAKHMVLAGIFIVILLVSAFFLGWFLRS